MGSFRRLIGASITSDSLVGTSVFGLPDNASPHSDNQRLVPALDALRGDIAITDSHATAATDMFGGLADWRSPAQIAPAPDVAPMPAPHAPAPHTPIVTGRDDLSGSHSAGDLLTDHGASAFANVAQAPEMPAIAKIGDSLLSNFGVGQNFLAQSQTAGLLAQNHGSGHEISNLGTHLADSDSDASGNLPDPELWITAFSGSDENLLIHADDTGTGVASNTGTLYTPDSANQPNFTSEARLFTFDTEDNVYVVVTENAGADPTKILVGSLSTVLANPTNTPSLTTVFTDTSDGGAGFEVSGLAVDPDNSEIYFVDHQSLEKVSYAGTGLTVLGSVTSLTDPETGASVFMDGLALDLPHQFAFSPS